jgi:hypothetical protein
METNFDESGNLKRGNRSVILSNIENQPKSAVLFSPLQHELVLLLEKQGPMKRGDIVQELKRPRTTIYDNLTDLINRNIVFKYPEPTNMHGRPVVKFTLSQIF